MRGGGKVDIIMKYKSKVRKVQGLTQFEVPEQINNML